MMLATKAQVHYRSAKSKEYRCATCAFFISPNSCRKVSGQISPDGWCDMYKPAIPAKAPPMRGIPAAGAKEAQEDHPRTHALAIAGATHLHKSGYLPAVDKARIHAKAKANLKRLRGKDKDGD